MKARVRTTPNLMPAIGRTPGRKVGQPLASIPHTVPPKGPAGKKSKAAGKLVATSSNDTHVAQVNDTNQLRVQRNKVGNADGVDIRKWYFSEGDQDWKPTQKGIFLRVDDSLTMGDEGQEMSSAEFVVMVLGSIITELHEDAE